MNKVWLGKIGCVTNAIMRAARVALLSQKATTTSRISMSERPNEKINATPMGLSKTLSSERSLRCWCLTVPRLLSSSFGGRLKQAIENTQYQRDYHQLLSSFGQGDPTLQNLIEPVNQK